MFFKYKKGDIVKCSLSEDENYLFLIDNQKWYKSYSGLCMPLEWVRIGPGRKSYYTGMEKPLFVNLKICTLQLTPQNNTGKIIRLEGIKEKLLSPFNTEDIHLDEPFENITKSFQNFLCLSSYP